ncbi:NAD(P)/FAD-dependent oxidoreductase [Winogradskya consettensis]|uniref:Pyridine nucleotide-disulfide oxidoreductase domain-containing protein 2 n=1 Tax=Winogradskya consettensis TaxID=113560 RepID=A0A919SEH7_9ACTN|nr:NAD(P)/FAD-dependent oxidoreductase [Actinoplanes consettensis]GIM70184.1 FAD-dependent oxidoreductase [Actinoplanes consettensis]
METFDVVIVGSGHNALVTAAYLTRAGRSVLVLERNDRPGGLVRTEELTVPGFHHDVYSSAHPLLLAGPVYADLGPQLEARGLTYVNTDLPSGVSFPDGRTAVVHRDMDAMVNEADRLAPGDGTVFADMLTSFAPYAGDLFGLFQQDLTAPGAADTVRRLFGGMTPLTGLLFDSARTVVGRFRSPELRAMLAHWVMHMGRTPDAADSGLWVILMTQAMMMAGMPIPVGGSQALTDALARIVTDGGGRIETGAEVTRIHVTGGRATAVETAAGERYTARQAVVAGTGPDQLYLHLLDPADVPASLRTQATGYRYGRGCVQIQFALSTPPAWPDSRFATIGQPHLTNGLDATTVAVAQATAGLLPADPTFTVDCPTALDPSRAPQGRAILRAQLLEMPIRPTGDALGTIDVGDGTWSKDLTERVVERTLDTIDKHIPGVRGTVLAHATVTPDDLAGFNPNCGPGDPYGGANDLAQSYLLRPLPGHASHRSPIDGLFMVGAATWPGHGISGASGYIVAQQLLADR